MARRVRHIRRAAGALALFATFAAGCGRSTSTASAPVQSAPGATTAAPTTGATVPGPLASLALPTFDLHAAPGLEATLPDAVGGRPLRKASYTLAQLNALGMASTPSGEQLGAWAQALGKGPGDVLIATATPQTGETPSLQLVAIQIRGADPARLLPAFEQAQQPAGQVATPTSVAGKQVISMSGGSQSGLTTYAYPKADVLYMATSSDPSTAAAAIQALP